MNKNDIIIGVIFIVFMVVGTISFFIGQSTANLFYRLFGVFLLLTGFIVSMFGVIVTEPKEKTVQQPQIPHEQKQVEPPV
jgi:hypothetical protein